MKITYKRAFSAIKDTVVFSVDYPIGANGLVRLKQNTFFPNKNKNKLTINTHDKNIVSVEAIMEKVDADKKYEWDTKSIIYTPWHQDTNYDIHNIKYNIINDNTVTATQKEIIRGGNRLLLNLRQKAEFYVTIPHDSDLETDLCEMDVDYKSIRYTKLNVDCNSVNKWGDSGSSTSAGESWTYYDFSEKETDPITHIVTKGNAKIPINIRNVIR